MRAATTFLTATLLFFAAISVEAQTADGPAVMPDAASMAGFGASLLIDGNTIVVARTGLSAMFPEPPSQWGGLHVFGVENGAWGELYSIGLDGSDMGEDFGRSMAMMGDALLVGAPRADSAAGKIYIFQKGDDGRFGSVDIFQLPDAQPNDSTGNRLAVSGDMVLIGVPGRKQVHAYRWQDGAWHSAGIMSSTSEEPGRFPRSIAFDGTTALVGEPAREGGAITTYAYSEDGWGPVGTLTAPEGSRNFGVAMLIPLGGSKSSGSLVG